jgi:hypothetical protein
LVDNGGVDCETANQMNRKFKFIVGGLVALGYLIWADANNVFSADAPMIVFYLVALALIVIGFCIPKTGDKKSKCPHCNTKGKNRVIFQAKGKDQKKLVMQCKSCDGGVYLDRNGVASKIPTSEWERIRELDKREGRS